MPTKTCGRTQWGEERAWREDIDGFGEVCGVILDHSEKTLAGKLVCKPVDHARVLQKFTCWLRTCVGGDDNVKGMGQGLIS